MCYSNNYISTSSFLEGVRGYLEPVLGSADSFFMQNPCKKRVIFRIILCDETFLSAPKNQAQ